MTNYFLVAKTATEDVHGEILRVALRRTQPAITCIPRIAQTCSIEERWELKAHLAGDIQLSTSQSQWKITGKGSETFCSQT